jgi:tetratricopeptide (TPR) repeat protein
VNKPDKLRGKDDRQHRPVFVSYATADRKEAQSVCKGIERRGTKCWISSRDVAPGENYQEAIVRSIRNSRAIVLVFSDAANNSEEIKKELSLASRYRLPVMALRIEDVEPSDAFAYELSTRQWIDAFQSWDKSIDTLVRTLDHHPGKKPSAPSHDRRALDIRPTRAMAIIAGVALLLVAGVAAWFALRPVAAPAQGMRVQLGEFKRLSPDLPQAMSDAIRDELVSAFPQDGTISVITGDSARGAYVLSGTVRHEGDKIRGIARLAGQPSGETIWSKNFEYPATAPEKLPHWFAVDAADVVKCGLSAASTYPRRLPPKALTLYLSICSADSAQQQLDAARRLVQASPDFSSGWSALGTTALRTSQGSDLHRADLRREAGDAAAKALRLDPNNAEAYVTQSLLLNPSQMIEREALLKKAAASRPLECGCEHRLYAWFLWETGKIGDAREEMARSITQEPFDVQARTNMAELLLLGGFSQADADEQYKAAADIVPDPDFVDLQKLWAAPITGNYRAALATVMAGTIEDIPPVDKAALIAAYNAVISGNPAAKQNAAAMLDGLPGDHKTYLVVLMLGAVGANAEALRQMEEWDEQGKSVRARLFLWYPSMRGVISDPSFPAVAQRMGLMTYWKTTHTKPDVCGQKDAPRFCRMI